LVLAAAAVAAAVLVPGTARAADPITVTIVDGVLSISGDGTANTIALRLLAGDSTHLVIDVGDDGTAEHTLARAGIQTITVDAGDGADTVRINDVNGSFTDTQPTTIDGGPGDDTVTGGAGGETISGQRGVDTIDAGGGADVVAGGGGDDVIDLGPGADRATWTSGDDADTLTGGGGQDRFQITGSDGRDPLTFAAAGRTLTFARGSGATTTSAVGFETVDVTPLGGADTVTTGSLERTGIDGIDVDLGDAAGAPDGAGDTIGVEGTDEGDSVEAFGSGGGADVFLDAFPVLHVTHADPGADAVRARVHGGDDTVVGLFLGAGDLRLVAEGGDDADVLIGGDADDTLRGGAGDDLLTGGPGTDVLDGGTGTDTLIQ
jgi:Ca2+-binding RTX toxin-like protein